METAIYVNCRALGDTIAAIPTVRKLSKAYETPLTVFSRYPDIFINHPCVKKSLHEDESKKGYNIIKTFGHITGRAYNIGGEDIEFKHSHIDVRQFHAISLGFSLLPDEMEMDMHFSEEWDVGFSNYVIVHPTYTWASRTWDQEKWQELVHKLNEQNIPVVAVGKSTKEFGWANTDKPVMDLEIPLGINLMDSPDSTLPKLRGLMQKARCIVLMDSGLLHLAGTTDVEIIQLGSSINPKLRAPYRNNSQEYKYQYIKGGCELFCASDLKYNIKEHNTIQGVPLLSECQEKKSTFECHPSTKQVMEAIEQTPEIKTKLLYFLPHMSTGGMPQYVLEQVRTFNDLYEIYILEYNNYSNHYTIQREKLEKIIPDSRYFRLDDINKYKPEAVDIVKNINPDIIHFQDPPSWFIDTNIMDMLVNLPNKPYFIVTPHSKDASPDNCSFIPDRYVLVSKWAYEKYEQKTDVPCDIWEYPIKDFKVDKDYALDKLNLDPNYTHILNVGIFTEGKNQGEVFEVARLLEDKPVKFHFIGNQAGNFKNYWEPIIKIKPENCIIWGERSDVGTWMQACDLFYFSSKLELNPLVVKEALSYKLPVMMKKLETYLDTYDNNPLVTYIGDNIQENTNTLKKLLGYDL